MGTVDLLSLLRTRLWLINHLRTATAFLGDELLRVDMGFYLQYMKGETCTFPPCALIFFSSDFNLMCGIPVVTVLT